MDLRGYCIFVLISCCLLACQRQEGTPSEEKFNGRALEGIASPLRMNSDTALLVWSDYLLDQQPDSIDISEGFSILKIYDKTQIISRPSSPSLGLIQCWLDGCAYSIPLIKNKKQKVTIKYIGKDATAVSIAGEMNNWSPKPMQQTSDKHWELTFMLEAGRYQYQMIVDEVWGLDPANKNQEDNGIGGINSVLIVGGQPEMPKNPRIIVEDNSIKLLKDKQIAYGYVLWDNVNLEPSVQGDTLIYSIPKHAKNRSRSHIKGWTVDTNDNLADFLIPLENGQVINDVTQLQRSDKQQQVLYFMLVDRFHNGDISIDAPLSDADVHPKANYWGGDLEGIRQKLEEGYFDSLGINTIWLSPITQNPLHAEVEYPAPHRKYSGYHGYWPISCTQIDRRFGNSKDLKQLVQKAHDKNINVILDYVSNHVHQENPVYQQHPDWATTLDLPDGTKNIRIWDEQRLTTWFDLFLPTLDFSNKEAVELMTDSALFMLQAYGIDGFRHDATKHIPENYWRRLTQKIKQTIDKPVFQIGETFGSRALIGSYVNSGMMDGQFDFNLYFDMRTAFARDNSSMKKLHQSMIATLQYYGMNSLMGNITGNHDIPRFISYASGALRFDEDEKAAGWDRDIQVKDAVGYQKLNLLTAFIMTIPGVPVVYYGDEIGMAGAGDPDNRRPMKFDNLSNMEQSVLNNTKTLIKLRNSRMSLMYGNFEVLESSYDSYAYRRTYLDEQTSILLNRSDKEKTFTIDNKNYSIPPYSYKIIL